MADPKATESAQLEQAAANTEPEQPSSALSKCSRVTPVLPVGCKPCPARSTQRQLGAEFWAE